MAQNLTACDREQPFLLPPDVREGLAENHLAWLVIDARFVERHAVALSEFLTRS